MRLELIAKSREAALNAVQTFNNPLTTFKTESFIVLIVIAWTYLLHAYYRSEGVDYRYWHMEGKRKRLDRTKTGAIKLWDLERCLKEACCPLDEPTKQNLRFLIGLRHEVEHQMALGLDTYLSSRYQACCLNFNFWLTQLFGARYSIETWLTVTLQFGPSSVDPLADELASKVPKRLVRYVSTFDESLTEEVFNSPRYAYRLLFVRRAVGKIGQADRVIEFIPADSELASRVGKEFWVLKDVERPKYRAKKIIQTMHAEGFESFNSYHHTQLWKSLNAKNPAKGYGVVVEGEWFWYDRWIDEVRSHCRKNAGLYIRGPKGNH